MVKLSLQCAIVGQIGSSFDVEIDDGEKVSKLKEAIRTKKHLTITCEADQLQLFLAKQPVEDDDGKEVVPVYHPSAEEMKEESFKWLPDEHRAALNLVNGEPDDYINSLTVGKQILRSKTIATWLYTKNSMELPSNEQIHVLVVVPYLEQSQADVVHESLSLARQASVRQSRMEMRLEQLAASLPHKNSKSYTDGALGQLLLARLGNDELILNLPATGDGEAFWSADIQLQADAYDNEAAFIAFITPFFSSILRRCGLVFVNSEKYQWLPQSTLVTKSTDLKPDGFATHRGMYRGKRAPNDKVLRPNGFRFGVAEEELFDCIILFKSKLSITEAAFGQVARYFQNLHPKASASAILFDRRSFWLIKSHESIVVKVQVGEWANRGSKSFFQRFITDNISPWVTHLSLSCQNLGVDVVEGDAFLGRGAHGRVFRVTKQNGEVFALKLVEKDSVKRLYQEEKALRNAQLTGLTASPVGNIIETPESAALLLSPVGKPLPRPTTRHEVQSLFEMLRQLHKNGLVHGDPRVPNVILDGEKPLWIDLVEVMEASPTFKQIDAEILTRSILSISRSILLDPELGKLIRFYAESDTSESLDKLAKAVCDSLAISN